ncbi:hypothetical protein EMCRGX_G034495 [Ephydatia muelleri]
MSTEEKEKGAYKEGTTLDQNSIGIKESQQTCKNEGVSSSCSTNKASTSSASTATDKAKGAECMDKFVSQVQPVTVMKGDKFARANELLEFRDFLAFISGGTYVPPHRTKVTELIDLQYAKVLIKIKMLMANAPISISHY